MMVFLISERRTIILPIDVFSNSTQINERFLSDVMFPAALTTHQAPFTRPSLTSILHGNSFRRPIADLKIVGNPMVLLSLDGIVARTFFFTSLDASLSTISTALTFIL